MLLGIFALILAGCGGGAQDGGEGAEGGEVELTVWFARDYYVPPDQFKSFHEEHPNITVNFDVVPADDIFQQLVRMNEAGEDLPDVVQMDGFFQNLMYEAGIARDITDLVERWEQEEPELFEQVYPAVWEQGTWDGKIVGMANTAQLGQFFYRTDWFEEAGIEWPTTWEGLYEATEAVAEVMPGEGYPMAMGAARGEGANRLAEHAYAMGVPHENGIPQLNTEAGRYLIDWHQRLARNGLIHPETITWTSDEYRAAFQSGTTAIMDDSIGKAVDVENAGLSYGENYELALLPISRTGGGEQGERIAWFRTWQITTGSENPYEASLVLRYLIRPQQAVDVTLQGGDLPRTSSVLDSQEIAEQIVGFTEEFADAFANAAAPPTSLQWFEIEDTWELLIQDILKNPEMPPAELASRWQAEFDAIETD